MVIGICMTSSTGILNHCVFKARITWNHKRFDMFSQFLVLSIDITLTKKRVVEGMKVFELIMHDLSSRASLIS